MKMKVEDKYLEKNASASSNPKHANLKITL